MSISTSRLFYSKGRDIRNGKGELGIQSEKWFHLAPGLPAQKVSQTPWRLEGDEHSHAPDVPEARIRLSGKSDGVFQCVGFGVGFGKYDVLWAGFCGGDGDG
jgi:hypothetical protein